MGRNIGGRVIEACEIVDEFGICGSPQVTPLLGTVPTNTLKYLSRAVSHGLLTVDRAKRPHQYSAVPGWRDKIKPAKPRREPISEGRVDGEPIVQRAIRTQPSWVFGAAGTSAESLGTR